MASEILYALADNTIVWKPGEAGENVEGFINEGDGAADPDDTKNRVATCQRVGTGATDLYVVSSEITGKENFGGFQGTLVACKNYVIEQCKINSLLPLAYPAVV